MGVDTLKEALPEYAKDLKLNLGSVARGTVLSPSQLWGTLVATAAATRNEQVFKEIREEAAGILTPAALDAALGAASVMAMTNVFYRGRGFLDGAYDDLRPGLRMNIVANPGVEKSEFELWCFAVSAINGCHYCVGSHEQVLREAGLTREQVLEALKIAAIVAGVAQAMATVPALV